jgi:hypothetical protein
VTGNPLEFFQPGLEYWNREKERQRHEAHQYVVDAPPWDLELDGGVIRLGEEPPSVFPPGSVGAGSATDDTGDAVIRD